MPWLSSPRSANAWTCVFILVAGLAQPHDAAAEPYAPTVDPAHERQGMDPPKPLSLEDVLRSVAASFPLISAAEASRDARTAEAMAAAGRFDTSLGASADLRPVGFYENYGGSASLVQPTRLWGARFFGGYRVGAGDYGSYDGGRLTDSAGEIAGGIAIPLLRGGAIDDARASLKKAKLALERAGPEIELQRIEFMRDAANAFWIWFASGQRVDVAERLLAAAALRQDQIEGRVARGAQSRIDLIDNERLIVDRKLKLRTTERNLRRAAIGLSLYLRDERGDPIVVDRERLPTQFPPEQAPDHERFELDLSAARQTHPVLRVLALERQKLEVDTALARNDSLPKLDLRVEGSQDIGASRPGIDETGKLSLAPRSEAEVKALVRLELPLQRREARGQRAAAQARLAQLARREQYARDRLQADVLGAIESLSAAFEQTEQARENLALAAQLRAAEERKLALGSSNLINVNIREVQEATAERGLIDAQAAYFRAQADYGMAVARPLDGPHSPFATVGHSSPGGLDPHQDRTE